MNGVYVPFEQQALRGGEVNLKPMTEGSDNEIKRFHLDEVYIPNMVFLARGSITAIYLEMTTAEGPGLQFSGIAHLGTEHESWSCLKLVSYFNAI